MERRSRPIQYDTTIGAAKPVRDATVTVSTSGGLNGIGLGSTFTAEDGSYFIVLPPQQGGYANLSITVKAKSRPADKYYTELSSFRVSRGLSSTIPYSVSFNAPAAGMPLLQGQQIVASHVIGSVTDAERAFWIFDAALTGSRMQSLLPGASVIRPRIDYPSSESSASGGNFNLTSDAFNNWDTILHEYGHTIQANNRFWSDTGLTSEHHLGQNQRLEHPTSLHSNVLQLAFVEGFADFFSVLAQREIGVSTPPVNVNGVIRAGDRNFWGWDAETSAPGAVGRGEDEEMAIMRILWDLYDPANEPYDRVELGYEELFHILKSDTIETLDELWDALGRLADGDDGKIIDYGAIFEAHNVSPRPVANIVTTRAVPPMFSWDVPRGSDNATNLLNDFGIKIFRGDLQIFDSGLLGRSALVLPGAGAGGVDRMTWIPPGATWDAMYPGTDGRFIAGEYRWVAYGINKVRTRDLAYIDTGFITTGQYWSDARDLTVNR